MSEVIGLIVAFAVLCIAIGWPFVMVFYFEYLLKQNKK